MSRDNDMILLGLLELDFEAIEITELLGYTPQEPSEVRYFYRSFLHNHQYISLMYYEGRFLEAVLEVFWIPRSKKPVRHNLELRDSQMNGTVPVFCSIFRDKTILTAIEKEYPLSANEKGN